LTGTASACQKGHVPIFGRLQAIGNMLPKYMIPVVYNCLDELKRNPNGKIDRLYYSKLVENNG
jgi:hypothetical protein